MHPRNFGPEKIVRAEYARTSVVVRENNSNEMYYKSVLHVQSGPTEFLAVVVGVAAEHYTILYFICVN